MLPGGDTRSMETLHVALRREVVEELRCRCVVGDPVTAFWYVHRCIPRTASIYTVMKCTLLSDPLPATGEIERVCWAPLGSLPARTLSGVVAAVEETVD